ncbi:MAG: hypothetical protein ACUVRD_01360 [Bacteroidia bacterium]
MRNPEALKMYLADLAARVERLHRRNQQLEKEKNVVLLQWRRKWHEVEKRVRLLRQQVEGLLTPPSQDEKENPS